MTSPRLTSLAVLAERFRAFHRGEGPLVLANVWDAATARAVEAAGAPAIATTSGGVAEALGHSDGEATPVGEMLGAVRRIATAVSVPVTADMEGGYGLPAPDLVAGLLEAGAVGLNLEDGDHRNPGRLHDAERQAGYLADVKAAGRAAGVDMVVNARIDVILRGVGPPEDRMEEILARARAYLAAGADCVYPIALAEEASIATLVAELRAPVNVLLRREAPSVSRLAALGVARASLGTGLFQAVRDDVAARAASLYGA